MIKKRVFSLVELLVVMSTLAILATLLMKSLTSITSKSEMVHCLSRMRGLSMGLASFAGDNNENTVNTDNTIKPFTTINSAHYIFRPVWRTHVLPDYLGADTRGGSQNFPTWYKGEGWSVNECREWNESQVLSCPTAINTWGKGDVDAFQGGWSSWLVGTGTMALNAEISQEYAMGNKRISNFNQIERPSLFAQGFCSGIGFRGNGGPHTGPYDLAGSGYGTGVETNGTVPLFPHGGGKVWQWSRQENNTGYFVDGECSTLFGDGHIQSLESFDIPEGSLLGRNDISEESRLFWFGYSENEVGSND